ncbi:MAG TPA: Fe-S cluster assembly protein SufD [Thermoanaerobaculia bacterium]|nr:Fe-S cluster assembly protein SufD [Thermoanaerobaculia bacterium]
MNAVATTLKERAAERFAQLGWPTPRIEEWKYTNLGAVAKASWRDDEAPRAIESAASLTGRAAYEIVFVNGVRVSSSGDAPATFTTDATLSDWERNALVALNLAQTRDGAVLDIPAGTVVHGFIHLLFIGNGDGIWSHPRNVIRVGANAQVTIVETYVGSGKYFTNAVTELDVADGAVVDHYRLECESFDAFHVGHVYVKQGRASSVTSRVVAIGAAIARNEIYVALNGEGASVSLDGLFAGSGTQHLDNTTVIDHLRPHCESHELYKGVLDQNARGVFDGRIIVRPDAMKTVSRQENRNLLLSDTAIVDSKPTLEIHNDDVKCNHGSTIGQLDDEQMFYLRSRGIDEAEARNLLVYAFASEIVDRMKIEPVREQIRRALFQTIPDRLPERRGNTR